MFTENTLTRGLKCGIIKIQGKGKSSEPNKTAEKAERGSYYD